MMRVPRLNLGSILGVMGLLFLPVSGLAQSQQVPPQPTLLVPTNPFASPPALIVSPATPPPTAAPAVAPATAATPAAPAASPPPAAAPTPPAASAPAPEKAKALAKAKAATKHKVHKAIVAHEPRDIVVEIYRVAGGPDGNYDGPSALTDKKIRQLYFSKELTSALTAMDARSAKTKKPVLGFDPITNSQEPDVQNLDIDLESQKPDRIIVSAKFRSTSDSSIVHYDFIKEGNAWKLDNIRGEIQGQSGQWSLRDIIGNALHQP